MRERGTTRFLTMASSLIQTSRYQTNLARGPRSILRVTQLHGPHLEWDRRMPAPRPEQPRLQSRRRTRRHWTLRSAVVWQTFAEPSPRCTIYRCCGFWTSSFGCRLSRKPRTEWPSHCRYTGEGRRLDNAKPCGSGGRVHKIEVWRSGDSDQGPADATTSPQGSGPRYGPNRAGRIQAAVNAVWIINIAGTNGLSEAMARSDDPGIGLTANPPSPELSVYRRTPDRAQPQHRPIAPSGDLVATPTACRRVFLVEWTCMRTQIRTSGSTGMLAVSRTRSP